MTGAPIHTKDAIKLAFFILINKYFPPGPQNTVNNYLFKGRVTIGPPAACRVLGTIKMAFVLLNAPLRITSWQLVSLSNKIVNLLVN